MVVACRWVLTSFHFVGVAHAVQIVVVRQHHPTPVGDARARLTGGEWVHAQIRVAVCGEGIEVASQRRQTSHHLIHITHPVSIGVGHAVASTFPHRIQLVAFAIAFSFQNGCAATFVDRTWAVAHAARVQSANAFVHIVAHAVAVFVRSANPATFTKGIQDISVAITFAFQDSWAVANPAFVVLPHTWIHIVTQAVAVLVNPGASAHPATVGVQTTAVVNHRICIVGTSFSVGAPLRVFTGTVVVEHGALRMRFKIQRSLVCTSSTLPVASANGEHRAGLLIGVAMGEVLDPDLT